MWVGSPFLGSYVFFPELVYARELPVRGRTDVLSRPRLPVSSRIAFGISSLLPGCSAESFCTRAAGRVSRPRLRTTSNPQLYSSILLIPTRSSCASRVWTDTVFGVSGCSRTGLCGFVSTHFGCPRCMSVSWIFPDHIRGLSGLEFQRSLELAFSNLSASAMP